MVSRTKSPGPQGKLEESGPIWRAYYPNSTATPSEAQDGFHTWLSSGPPRGSQLITKLYDSKRVDADRAYCDECGTKVQLSCPNGAAHRLGNQQQKGVDVAIATLALIHQDRCETLLTSSGDGDLLEAIEFLTEHGKRFELAVFTPEGVSTDLQARADRIHWISDSRGAAGAEADRHSKNVESKNSFRA